jgi:3D (Asp-Asp-Asp) domain-containing protein
MNIRAHWGALMAAATLAATVGVTWPAFAASHTITVMATAYGPSAQDNYPYGATDFFGQPLTQGDVAVDPSVIPLHTCLYISGYQSPSFPAGGFLGEADDQGGAIQGRHIDLFMNASPAQVSNFGVQTVHVTLLGPASKTSLSGTAACQAYASAVPGQAASETGALMHQPINGRLMGPPVP